MKPIIICIVGESGSGKTTLANMLEADGIPMIESRTTRPPRFVGESGHTFVSDEEFDTYDKSDMIAYTKFGDYRYCCLLKDVYSPVMTYVIDEFGLQYLREHFSNKFSIFAVRVMAPMSKRVELVGMERVQRDNDRFTLTEKDFDYFIDNPFDETLEYKKDALLKYLKNHKW